MREKENLKNEDIKTCSWDFRDNSNNEQETYFSKNNMYKENEERAHQNLVINACITGDLKIIKEYLHDHNVNAFLYTGWTPLLYAASFCNIESIKYLLTQGADVDKHKDGFTPLMALCSSTKGTTENCLHCLSLLIEASANVKATNKEKQTALMYACKARGAEVVMELIKHIKNINVYDNEGQTALVYAVLANKPEIVKLLLENGANVTIKNRRYQTAKDIAELKGFQEISLLLSNEDDVVVTYKVFQKEEWQDMFPRLCHDNDKVVDNDIASILYGMGLQNYTNLFQGIKLQQFLQLTEKDLLHLGMDISVHRTKFLNHLYKFHCKTWSTQTMGVINKSEPYTLYNGIQSMGNVATQISIMTSTFHYVKYNLDNAFCNNIFANDAQVSEYEELIKNIEKTLTNLKKEFVHVKDLVDKINVENRLPIPPCYIGPKTAKHLSYKPIIWSILLICGIYLAKVHVSK